MFMHGSSGNIHYAEFRRMGHRTTQARYPVHLHMLGNDFENKMEPGSGMVIRGNSVWISGHRFYVIHDTNGTLVEDNVGFNGFGHGYYMEKTGSSLSNPTGGRFCRDCPEGPHDNVFSRNLAVYSRGSNASAANFWLEHLDQVLLGNYASGGGSESSGVGASDDMTGGGFGTAEVSNGSGRIQVPLFIKNEAVSNFTNGLWTWNNNVPSNMAIIEFSAIRNGKSGMRWGAYGADYRFYQSRFIENGQFGLNITSVRSHLQDSLVQGGSSSGSKKDVGFFIGNYVAPLSPNGPVRLTRTTFQNHRTVDLRQISANCSDPEKEKAVMVAGLINDSCGPVYLEARGTQFLSANPIDFGSPANANNFWRIFGRTGFPDTLYLRSDQLNSANHGDLTSGLVPPVASQLQLNSAVNALTVPMSAFTGPITFSDLRDHRGRAFSYTFDPVPDYPPEVSISVSVADQIATITATATDDNAVDRVEIFADERLIGQGSSITYDLANHGRKFAYLYARAYDNQNQVSYSTAAEIGPEVTLAGKIAPASGADPVGSVPAPPPPPADEDPAPPEDQVGGLISNLQVASGKDYRVVNDFGVSASTLLYIDREYFVTSASPVLDGATYVKTANDDKDRTDSSFLSFEVSEPAIVYIAYDSRAASLPNWLSTWINTGEIVETTDVPFRVYSKSFPTGTVSLGGNRAAGVSGPPNMYVALVEPDPDADPDPPPSQDLPITSLEKDHLFLDRPEPVRVRGTNLDPSHQFTLRLRNPEGELTIDRTVQPKDATDIEVTFTQQDLTNLEPGFHTVELEREGETASFQLLITKLGDLTKSGRINLEDVSILLSRWGSTDPSDLALADINGPDGEPDGSIDIWDANVLMRNWNP